MLLRKKNFNAPKGSYMARIYKVNFKKQTFFHAEDAEKIKQRTLRKKSEKFATTAEHGGKFLFFSAFSDSVIPRSSRGELLREKVLGFRFIFK